MKTIFWLLFGGSCGCVIGGLFMLFSGLGSSTPIIVIGFGEAGVLGAIGYHHGLLRGIEKRLDGIEGKLDRLLHRSG